LTDEAVLVGDHDAVELPLLQIAEKPLEGRPDDGLLESGEVVVLVDPRDPPPAQCS